MHSGGRLWLWPLVGSTGAILISPLLSLATGQDIFYNRYGRGSGRRAPARKASAIENAACMNFSTSANSSSERRRAASLAR